MVLPLSGVPPESQIRQHNHPAPAGFFTGSHRASLRTQAVSQSVETEAIDLFLVPLEKTTPGRTQPISSLSKLRETSMPKNKVSDLITDQEMAFARLVLSGTMTDRDAAQAVFASLAPELTRGSITAQVKALSMIVAIQGLIPDRRAGASENKSGPPPSQPEIYRAAWLRRQQGENIDPEPAPSLAQEEDEPGLTGPEPTPGSAADAPPPPTLSPALSLTPATPRSPTASAPRKPRHRRLRPPGSLLFQTPESLSL
jgi:hypothetical protein